MKSTTLMKSPIHQHPTPARNATTFKKLPRIQ
jgi:hypothetical protein